jgi:hypothetical protein
MSERIERLLEFVEEPHRTACLNFITEFKEFFDTSKGSAIKHQPWLGGYRDHVTEVMHIAMVTYHALERIRPLPFSLSDALFGCFLHDVEKIWKHAIDLHEDLRKIDKNRLLRTYFDLNDDHWNAIKYAHGEGDDYHPTDRIQGPLGAFVHHCDNTSARIWFDKPTSDSRSIPACFCGDPVDQTNPDCVEFGLCRGHSDEA